MPSFHFKVDIFVIIYELELSYCLVCLSVGQFRITLKINATYVVYCQNPFENFLESKFKSHRIYMQILWGQFWTCIWTQIIHLDLMYWWLEILQTHCCQLIFNFIYFEYQNVETAKYTSPYLQKMLTENISSALTPEINLCHGIWL